MSPRSTAPVSQPLDARDEVALVAAQRRANLILASILGALVVFLVLGTIVVLSQRGGTNPMIEDYKPTVVQEPQ
jgi:hypothetical protein